MKFKRIRLISFFLLLSTTLSFSTGLEVPLCEESEITDHEWYKLKYNEVYEQPDWAAYELTRNELEGNTPRKDHFRVDPSIQTGSAELSDYRGSGYDRGHLVPAGDLKISKEAMDSSFYLSNISPQVPAFNRGIWLDLENYVRTWAWEHESAFIVTGPIFTNDELKVIGINEVAVPDYFYKAVLIYTNETKKAIGFILPNMDIDQPISDYIVSIDVLEKVSGEELYPLLPPEQARRLESAVSPDDWIWEEFNFLSREIDDREKAIPIFWINSSTGTRHNSECEYYGNTKKGYYTDKKLGTACGRCGG